MWPCMPGIFKLAQSRLHKYIQISPYFNDTSTRYISFMAESSSECTHEWKEKKKRVNIISTHLQGTRIKYYEWVGRKESEAKKKYTKANSF